MPQPLGWFRSNNGKFVWLAFFALACQFVFTFGHVHFANVSVISAAPVSSAQAVNNSADAPTSPAQQTPTGLAGLSRSYSANFNYSELAVVVGDD